MKIYIKDENIDEALYLLKSIKDVLYKAEGGGQEDFAPEILTISDFINQIENEKNNRI